MNIKNLVEHLLPDGTANRYLTVRNEKLVARTVTDEISWDACPYWPPDVFAVVATIIDRSSCYVFASPNSNSLHEHSSYLKEVIDIAEKWGELNVVPPQIQQLWSELIKHGGITIEAISEQKNVRQILFKLFAIADEACRGMGWTTPQSTSPSDKASEQIAQHTVKITDLARSSLLLQGNVDPEINTMILPYVPFSLCSLVPLDVAIVLPKSMTAAVGCTIRSLSHHLALLPGQTQVLPSWRMADRDYQNDVERMRLLIVPFPFHVPENSFTLSQEPQALIDDLMTPGYFSLEQKWLTSDNVELDAKRFVNELILPLLVMARRESRGRIHGILMPECALSDSLAKNVADRLVEHDIEFFITGAIKRNEVGRTKNIALTYILTSENGKKGVIHGEQSKHHRWLLDQTQIKRYALNFPLDTKLPIKDCPEQWWEDIDVSERKLPFYAIRPDMSLTVLICEDMARNDPAMGVIRAVGPNLVIALLMDGAQLSTRWPARYATVLADDPGSSVLSITCAAMVDRSNWIESRPVRSIGLWRDSGGVTKELNLPHGCYGMLLNLKAGDKTQYTLDNRSDKNSTKNLTLESAIPLTLVTPPSWV